MARSKSAIGTAYVDVVASLQGVSENLSTGLKKGFKESSGELDQSVEEFIGQPIEQASETSSKRGLTRGFGSKSTMSAVGVGIAVIGAAVTAALAVAVSKGFEQQRKVSLISAALSLSDEESATLSSSISTVYAAGFGDSKNAVGDTMQAIIGSVKDARNMSEEDLTAMGKSMQTLVDVYGFSGEELARGLQSFTSAGLGTTEEFFTLMAKAGANYGAGGNSDFLDTLNEYSGDLKSAGLSTEDAFNFFNNTLMAGFRNTDDVADLARETNTRLRSSDVAVEDTLRKFGFDPANVKAAAAQGGKMWADTWTGILDTVAKSGTATDLASIAGSKSEDFYSASKATDWANVTVAALDTVDNSTEIMQGHLDSTAQSWDKTTRSIQSALQGAVTPLLVAIIPLAQGIAAWTQENQGLSAGILGTGIILTIALLTATIWSMNAALIASAGAVLMNPITWIVVGVVAAVALLVFGIVQVAKEWDTISHAIGTGVQWLSDGFVSLGNGLVGFFKGVANMLISVMNAPAMGINALIDGMAKLSITAPSWLGGGTWAPMAGVGWRVPLIPHLGTGADITGPTVALLGEAGQVETVVNRGAQNELIRVTTDLVKANSKSADNSVTIKVYPSAGMDERLLAEKSARLLEDHRERVALR